MSVTVLAGATLVTAAFFMVWWAVSGDRRNGAAARNLSLAAGPSTDAHRALLDHGAADRVVGPLLERLAARARRLTPAGRIDALERRILLAGTSAWPLERVLALKLLGGAGGAGLGLLLVTSKGGALNVVLAVGMALLGFFLPDLLLYNQAEKRQVLLRRELPDTLDHLTVSVEAGLGFDAALARAAHAGKGPLAAELARTLQDVQAGMSRGQALRALLDRTDVAELKQFVHAVIQAESFGIPLAQVLRVQASELRVKRRQLAEERALKLPVKVLFPLVFCIFPTMFIVILGPAALRMIDTLGSR